MSESVEGAVATQAETANVPSDLPVEGQTLDQKVEELVGTAEEAVEAATEEVTGEENFTEEQEEQVAETIQELKKKLKLKVNGREVEEEIDWNDEDKLTRELQKAKAFDQRSQEFAQLKKQVGDLVHRLQQEPAAVLADLGMDVDELAKNHLERRIQDMEKSPEQIEQERIQHELETARKELQEQRDKAEQAQMEQLRNHYAQEIETDIISALDDGSTILPKTEGAMRRIADAMHLAMTRGMNNVKAADVLPIVEQQYQQELQELFGALPAEAVEKALGKNILDKLRKRRVSRRKKPVTQTAKQIASDTAETAPREETDREKMSYKDLFDNF
jgi:hypothetical protein